MHLEVDIEGSSSVGGLLGEGDTIRIEDSSYNGTLTADDEYHGGLIGQADHVEVIRSSTSGTLVNSSGIDIGGLLGDSDESTIDQSFSSMNSNEGSTSNVGGLVGYLHSVSVITNSYARGDLAAGNRVGGLVGSCSEASISNSYATGEISAESESGGLVGESTDCVVTNSFWDTETSMQATSAADETGKTTAEMKDKSTFTNTATLGLSTAWNFSDTWAIVSTINDGYPCLQWQDDNCEITTDSDGIPSSEENAAPNGGDANNDGIVDSIQNHVSSFVNPITNTYAVVETDAACELNAVSATAESAKPVQDSGFNYASGLVNFTADCGTPGYTTTVRLVFFDKVSAGLTLRKFNPTTNAYFSVTGATVTDSIIGGRSAIVVSYQIVDGGVLDSDGIVNGVIVDPVGLAAQAVGVPNTGFAR